MGDIIDLYEQIKELSQRVEQLEESVYTDSDEEEQDLPEIGDDNEEDVLDDDLVNELN